MSGMRWNFSILRYLDNMPRKKLPDRPDDAAPVFVQLLDGCTDTPAPEFRYDPEMGEWPEDLSREFFSAKQRRVLIDWWAEQNEKMWCDLATLIFARPSRQTPMTVTRAGINVFILARITGIISTKTNSWKKFLKSLGVSDHVIWQQKRALVRELSTRSPLMRRRLSGNKNSMDDRSVQDLHQLNLDFDV